MGWLDKGFKNLVKGAKDVATSPAGIMLLGAAAPWLAPKMAPWAAKLAGSEKLFGSGKLLASALKSPWVKNALTNAAVQGGIATLTGSKHPWKAMGYSALASLPFTAMQSAQAAKAYNDLYKTSDQWKALTDAQQHAGEGLRSWYDFALGDELPMLTETALTGSKDYLVPGLEGPVGMSQELIPKGPSSIPIQSGNPGVDAILSGADNTTDVIQLTDKLAKASAKTPMFERAIKETTPMDLSGVKDIASSYFTKQPGKATEGWAGLLSDVIGPVDMPAAVIPQIAGMYGGRMTDEEQWLASQEKQIRMWAFQFGIPYEEAKEIFRDGYRNPYYQTQGPEDYGDFVFNKGGNMKYKDDYLSGGKAVGPGTGTSDSIRPVALSDGEFVFTEEATNNFPGGVEGLYSVMNYLDPNSEKPHEAREAIV